MVVYALTIALSAFLLFLIQPVIARQILPWFGGSAAVWTTCMVFFQVLLLFGYAYSDWLVRRLPRRRQAMIHAVLLIASLAWLPVVVPATLEPVDASHPAGRILLILATTIGLPYLMLATTGPLIQAWFAGRYQGARVYRLYALSNIASMAALISYPPLIEPNASSAGQSLGWSIGYAVFVGLAIVTAWSGRHTWSTPSLAGGAGAGGATTVAGTTSMSGRAEARTSAVAGTEAGASTGTDANDPATMASAGEPSSREHWLWLLLSATGSVLLLAITTHITQNIASIPFLWVLPLAIYLLTFILCFDGSGWYWRRLYPVLAALITLALLAGLGFRYEDGAIHRGILKLEIAVPLYAVGLFICCMFLHGELVERKPAPGHLTRFYLMVSLGGAVGGLLVGVVAPLVTNWYWELPIALVVVSCLVLVLARGWMTWLTALLAVFVSAALLFDYVRSVRTDAVELSRNFYGTLRINQLSGADGEPIRRSLLHGVILHGDQFFGPDKVREPTTYYGRTSGIGQTLAILREAGTPLKVGMVGVGTGTLTAYGQAGDVFRLYELNPAVFQIADRWFRYLADCPATVERVTGDARLMMAREPDQGFDLLAVDAFSSDAIPIHLMTTEALAIYRRHLSARGAVLFHVSNRYLDLTGVVARLADEAGMTAIHFIDSPPGNAPTYYTDWIAVTASPELAGRLVEAGGLPMRADPATAPLWTDDHHNLFEVLY